MNLTLRSLASSDDLPGLEQLLLRGIVDADFWHTDPNLALKHLRARAYGSGQSLLLVAQDEAAAVQGFAICVPFLDALSGEQRPLLLLMWVLPALRRHGIARALVVDLRRLLRLAGHPGLQARIPHGDDALLAMGERWGLVRQWEVLSDY